MLTASGIPNYEKRRNAALPSLSLRSILSMQPQSFATSQRSILKLLCHAIVSRQDISAIVCQVRLSQPNLPQRANDRRQQRRQERRQRQRDQRADDTAERAANDIARIVNAHVDTREGDGDRREHPD